LALQNKIVIVLSGHPDNVAHWQSEYQENHPGKILTGSGAAAIIIVNLLDGDQENATLADHLSHYRRVVLAGNEAKLPNLPPTLITTGRGAEKLFRAANLDFTQARAAARRGESVSCAWNINATLTLRIAAQEMIGSNVAAIWPGSDDAHKDEAIVYSAHYDAFGKAVDGRYYPGAADNALGVGAMIATAEAIARAGARPRRAIIFLALVGEELGMLGSKYWVEHAPLPLAKIAANLNFDGIGSEVYGPVKEVVGFGCEYSDLCGTLAAAAATFNCAVAPDPFPEEKAFYRSDQISFARKGVPVLLLIGTPRDNLIEKITMRGWLTRAYRWLETDYHSTGDIVRSDWHWQGPHTLATIALVTGLHVADAPAMPAWQPTAPFNRQLSEEK
jgi:hypothetical protein